MKNLLMMLAMFIGATTAQGAVIDVHGDDVMPVAAPGAPAAVTITDEAVFLSTPFLELSLFAESTERLSSVLLVTAKNWTIAAISYVEPCAVAAVPLPASSMLYGSALLGGWCVARRRQRT